jgi:hypothetical protein
VGLRNLLGISTRGTVSLGLSARLALKIRTTGLLPKKQNCADKENIAAKIETFLTRSTPSIRKIIGPSAMPSG